MHFEQMKHFVAVSALAILPQLSEAPVDQTEKQVYIREEDIPVLGGLAINIHNRNSHPNIHTRHPERMGHLVHRLAGRNQQIGHRFRNDTRN